MNSSRPSAPKTQQAPAYVAPYVAPAPPPPPPPPPPVPAAPIPYYEQEQMDKNETANNNTARAKVGRSALKINLVNSDRDMAGSALNTTN